MPYLSFITFPFSRTYKILKSFTEKLIPFSFRLDSLSDTQRAFFIKDIIDKGIRCVLNWDFRFYCYNVYCRSTEIQALLGRVSRRTVFVQSGQLLTVDLIIDSRKFPIVLLRYDRWFTRNLPIYLDNLSRNYTATQGQAGPLKSESCNWWSLSETWSPLSVLI